MKIKLISFCDGYANSLVLQSRFRKQAEQTNFFDEIKILSLSTGIIGLRIKEVYGKFIGKNARGFGYWIWKPYALLNIAKESKYGDILVYCDIGCEFSSNGEEIFKKYINQAKQKGILSFYTGNGDPEYAWTKSELIVRFNLTKKKLQQEQVSASFFIIDVTDKTLEFLKEWVSISTECNYLYINDEIKLKQHKKFKEHRHDQSILSLLIKKYNIEPSLDKTEYPKKFYYKNSYIYKYPIHTIRNKTEINIIDIDEKKVANQIRYLKFNFEYYTFRFSHKIRKYLNFVKNIKSRKK